MSNNNQALDESEEYEVEKILDKRTREERVEYFLKWLGYPSSANSWESRDNLNCPELIAEFEDNRLKRQRINGSSTEPQEKQRPKICHFEAGWEVERIIGATDINGELEFLIKWKNSPMAELVKAEKANVKIPDLVIAFYEARLVTIHNPESECSKQDSRSKVESEDGRNTTEQDTSDYYQNGDSETELESIEESPY